VRLFRRRVQHYLHASSDSAIDAQIHSFALMLDLGVRIIILGRLTDRSGRRAQVVCVMKLTARSSGRRLV
jgi:hypothetical protein